MEARNSSNALLAGGILACVSSALFTGKVIVAKLAYARGIDPVGLVLLRMVFASPFFCAILLHELRKGVRVKGRDALYICLLGFMGYYVSSMLDFFGIEYISTALERMILQLSPSVVMLIGIVFLGEKLDRRLILSMAVGYMGVVLMVHSEHGGGSGSVLIGVSCIGGATLVFAVYMIFVERLLRRVPSAFVTSLAMLAASVCVFVHYAVAKGFTAPTRDPVVLSLGFVMAVFCTVVPSFLINSAIKRIGGARMGPFNFAGMGLTFVASAMLVDESFPVAKLSGIVMAAAGALLLTLWKTGSKSA
ncbi:MAG TPA: DMT family transporter [Opitutales bacterium]|nr:DMT family transporter [Opitutales bacterium]